MARSQPDGTAYRPSTAWREDVALEVWIDIEHRPASIRLAGTLDGATTADLISVVEELMADGHRSFVLDTRALSVRGQDGTDALLTLRDCVQRRGGQLTAEVERKRAVLLGDFGPYLVPGPSRTVNPENVRPSS